VRAAALSTRRDRYGIAKFLWSFVDRARVSQAFCNAVSLFFLTLLQPPDVVELPNVEMARCSQILAQPQHCYCPLLFRPREQVFQSKVPGGAGYANVDMVTARVNYRFCAPTFATDLVVVVELCEL